MIPRVIHRVWIGGEEPEWTREFAEGWKLPGWQLRQWDDENVEELFPLRNQMFYDNADLYAPDHVGQLRTDVLRYEILERFGGVYVDADLECVKPPDKLLDGADCFAVWEVDGIWVNNAFMGSVPTHPFIESLVTKLPFSVKANVGTKPNKMTGPKFITNALSAYRGDQVVVYPQITAYPYAWNEVEGASRKAVAPFRTYPEVFAIHHWGNKRRELSVPYA